jgi:acylphosphatase
MTVKICKYCLVSGRVQGVAFRAFTRRKALSLGVTGWARNLEDGRVAVLACGDEAAVTSLCQWLHKGSPFSKVSAVECQTVTDQPCPPDFTTA